MTFKPHLLFLVLFLLVQTGISKDVYALDNSVFTVRDVNVDITANSAANAREKAFETAQKKAFERLARRILRYEDASVIPAPDDSTLRRLIQDFEIRNEKLSSVRYKANFVFRFKERAVRSYFDSQGLSYTDVGSKPVLILPFYQSSSNMILWNDKNPWLQAWSRAEGNQGLVPVTIPLGDLQDVRSIRDDEALAYDSDKLSEMVERYGAGEAIILIAAQPRVSLDVVTPEDIAQNPLTVFVYRTDRVQPEFVNKMTLAPTSGETRKEHFDRSVARVFDILQKNWKEQTIVDPGEENNLRVIVEYGSLDEWVEIKDALQNVQGLLDLEYLSISPAQASIQLFFKGSEQRLRLALAQEDMALSKPRMNVGSLLSETTASQAPLIYELKMTR